MSQKCEQCGFVWDASPIEGDVPWHYCEQTWCSLRAKLLDEEPEWIAWIDALWLIDRITARRETRDKWFAVYHPDAGPHEIFPMPLGSREPSEFDPS